MLLLRIYIPSRSFIISPIFLRVAVSSRTLPHERKGATSRNPREGASFRFHGSVECCSSDLQDRGTRKCEMVGSCPWGLEPALHIRAAPRNILKPDPLYWRRADTLDRDDSR